MFNIIPTVIKKFYDKWNIQGFMLLSLLLQIILALFAPFRKRSRNPTVIWLIWSAYLLADWVANFTVGLISNNQKYSLKPDDHVEIRAFWTPFLLLHLGGPDTITAFSLEDNALWLRQLVGLVSQVLAAFIVFGQSLPRNKLWISTILLFVAGTIKYGERTYALYLANLNKIQKSMLPKPDPGPEYETLMEEYDAKIKDNQEVGISMVPEPPYCVPFPEGKLDDLMVVKYAYYFFETFKGLIVDAIFDFHKRDESQSFFLYRDSGDAFRVLAAELNFMYEILYTKVVVIYSKLGCIVRFISSCAIVAALLSFYSIDKHGFHKIDVGITYTLLVVAIGLDTIALFMLAFSDWTVASIEKFSSNNNRSATKGRSFLFLLRFCLSLKSINWRTDAKATSCFERARQILFRKWSESLHTFNLIDYCLKKRLEKNPTIINHLGHMLIYVIEQVGLEDFYDRMKYVSKEPIQKKLWDVIFSLLQTKSAHSGHLNIAPGGLVLQNSSWNNISSTLKSYIVDVNYDWRVIIWHIATDLCCSTNENSSNSDVNVNNRDEINNMDENSSNSDVNDRDEINNNGGDLREICKILSDYMLYLLVIESTMMSTVVGIGQIRFRDTCAEAKRFFQRKDPEKQKQKEHEWACDMILAVNTHWKPIELKGDRSKSVFFDACILAKELKLLDEQNRWELLSEVWVEFLSYAASHCGAKSHATLLSKGGELITFVWLLMTHFGMGDRFQIEGQVRAWVG